MKHHLVYKITNTINGKYYIGVHSTDKIDDGYMGSGVLIMKALKKYGKENFNKEILFDFGNEADAYLKELELLTPEILEDTKCYNVSIGGNKPPSFANKSPEVQDKMRDMAGERFRLMWTDPEWVLEKNKKSSNVMKGLWDRLGWKENNARMVQERWKDESYRNRMADSLRERNRTFYDSDKGKLHKKELSFRMAKNAEIWSKDPNNVEKRIRGVKKRIIGSIWITNGHERKRLPADAKIPAGWTRGMRLNEK